jgi:hypothetical protein
MEEARSDENGLYERPKSRACGEFDRLGCASGSARHDRVQLWPAEAKGEGAFSRAHTLRHEGASHRLEIRSRKGRGVWILVAGRVVFGETEACALANAVKVIDPEVEVVLDQAGRRLA